MSSGRSNANWYWIAAGAVVATLLAVGFYTIKMKGSDERKKAIATNNLKQLCMAIQATDAGRFPAAATYDRNGKPLLSWRVTILQAFDQQLYSEFHQDEPWDGPHNRTLIAKMPWIFESLGSTDLGEGETCYLAAVGEHEAFFGREGRRIFDFIGKPTIAIVEAAPDRKVIWTKPDDLIIDENNPAAGLGGWRDGVFLAAYCDGSVRDIPLSTKGAVLRALFQIDSHDPIPSELGN